MERERYYRPYISDTESESDSDSSGYTSEESLLNVPGKARPVVTGVPAPVNSLVDAVNLSKSSGTEFKSAESRNTSLFMINSRDRDTRIYPQPTLFTLRLPRVFRNIRQVNITQLNLLNSFFNFSASKANTFMYVYEQGRTIKDASGNIIDNAIKIQIRDGTYTADDLVLELTNALNSTPLFADITLGAFIDTFQTTGDFSILFNNPGSVVYNTLTQTYERNKTMSDIVARYFQVVQNVGTIFFSYNQTLVAYYYPIIKEMIIENSVPQFIVPSALPPGFENWYDYLVFAFQGLTDIYITEIALNTTNQATFDAWRKTNTFNNFLVNKYTCTYNSKQGRLVITSPSLNDSIQNDLNSQYTQVLGALVASNGSFTNIADFTNKYNTINNSNGALIEFYNFIQTRFASNFGVDFGRYTAEFYGESNNEISIYNTLNKYGWNLKLTPQVSANTVTSNLLPSQAPNYWSNIIIPQSELTEDTFVSTIRISEFTNNQLFFSNAGENQYGYTDVYFDVNATTYKRMAFETRCRQNISLLSLPRLLTDRTNNDMVYDLGSNANQTPLLFSNIGSNSYVIRTDVTNNLFNLYNVTQIMFNSSEYLRDENRWLNFLTPQILSGERIQPTNPNFGRKPAIDRIGLESFRPFIYFQLNADKYLVEPRAHFRIRFYVETQTGANFTVPIKITYYKDRAGFMADVAGDLAGAASKENARHFFKSELFNTTTNSASFVIDVNNNQATYFMVHYATADQRAPIALRVFSELEDEYGVYRLTQPTDYYDMPYEDLPEIADQFTPASEIFQNPLRSIYNSNVVTLGYDISGVSNNLLDYVIQTGSNLYYDPNTITSYSNAKFTGLQYEFNLLAGGAPQPDPSISSLSTNTGWSLYFDKSSSNIIKDLYTSNAAYFSTFFKQKPLSSNAGNEHLLVNWFKPGATSNLHEMFMTPSINESYNTKISTSSVFLPCINAKTPLTTDMSTVSDSYALDISGVSGLSFFLPPNELVKLDSFMVSFAYTQPTVPSADSTAIPFTRTNNPFGFAGTEFNGTVYRNNSASAYTTLSASNSWDDWYAHNRHNTKIGIYRTYDIAYMSTQSLQLSNALTTMTINKITQVANFQNQLGTLRTREPGWGTYYTYTFESNARSVWDINPSTYTWYSTNTAVDVAPVYIAGETTYSNYFLTPANIFNYTYQPRSVGIATTVGIAVHDSTIMSTFTADIPNSFTAVPFYMDPVTSNWTVGSFYGLSYTQRPALPTSIIGAAPYYGPPGVYGWTNQSNTLQLHSGLQTNRYETFYWNAKLQFETLDEEYDPATDLNAFGGFTGISNEYQDTVMFMYENSHIKQDLRDLSTVTTDAFLNSDYYWRWGMESNVNYKAWDDQGGYNYLSYIHDVPVRPTVAEYGVHVRAYDPIPRFKTGVRFIGKNFTDFGRPTLWEIANEISSLSGYTPITPSLANTLMTSYASLADVSPYSTIIGINDHARSANGNFISHEYADALITFDKTFSTSQVFGKKIGFTGKTFTLNGYEDAIVQYINYFNSIRGVISVYTTILSTATGLLNQYVTTRYGSVLPASILNRNRITDPLPFQFLLKSKLVAPYTTQFDEWGLGWNLGFNKRDTLPQTTITSDTFIRITQDYVYLRLNPELNMNTMSVSGKECRECCQDSAAEDNKYFSKIILNNFGGYCRSAVQLPKVFNPILGKYEQISCQLVDRNGVQINNADCEYDFVVEITEVTNKLTDDSTLQSTTADLNVYARIR